MVLVFVAWGQGPNQDVLLVPGRRESAGAGKVVVRARAVVIVPTADVQRWEVELRHAVHVAGAFPVVVLERVGHPVLPHAALEAELLVQLVQRPELVERLPVVLPGVLVGAAVNEQRPGDHRPEDRTVLPGHVDDRIGQRHDGDNRPDRRVVVKGPHPNAEAFVGTAQQRNLAVAELLRRQPGLGGKSIGLFVEERLPLPIAVVAAADILNRDRVAVAGKFAGQRQPS